MRRSPRHRLSGVPEGEEGTLSRRRFTRTTVATGVVAACALVVGVPIGAADASGNASCVGFEASAVSPPGSSGEAPGGMPDVIAFVKGVAGELGVPPGAIVSSVAKLHEGSHAACDEATEG
jgi:hypothetical protein